MDLDPYKQKVFVKLVEMAHELGIHTLAEGVETEGEYRWLAAQGVEYLQGYFFARPASPPPSSTPVLSEQAVSPTSIPLMTESTTTRLSLESKLDSDASQGVLDSLHEQVAVIDASGKILVVNHAWQQAGLEAKVAINLEC